VGEPAGAGFEGAESVWDLTSRLCVALVQETGASGCIVSRVIGDVLIQVAEHAVDGRTFQLGRGFLVSQFPTTAAVLETGMPQAVSVDDEDPDTAEVGVLEALGMSSVLMLVLGASGPWGLVEIYRESGRFAAGEIERATGIVAAATSWLVERVGSN
jgi:hypothetical protein